MSARREAKQFKEHLEAEGFTVRRLRGGHWEVRDHGRRVTTFPHSPSDHRWKKNAMSYIKKWRRAQGMNEKPSGL